MFSEPFDSRTLNKERFISQLGSCRSNCVVLSIETLSCAISCRPIKCKGSTLGHAATAPLKLMLEEAECSTF